jgi:hypothetical protein
LTNRRLKLEAGGLALPHVSHCPRYRFGFDIIRRHVILSNQSSLGFNEIDIWIFRDSYGMAGWDLSRQNEKACF